jgi:hypothetical protein
MKAKGLRPFFPKSKTYEMIMVLTKAPRKLAAAANVLILLERFPFRILVGTSVETGVLHGFLRSLKETWGRYNKIGHNLSLRNLPISSSATILPYHSTLNIF